MFSSTTSSSTKHSSSFPWLLVLTGALVAISLCAAIAMVIIWRRLKRRSPVNEGYFELANIAVTESQIEEEPQKNLTLSKEPISMLEGVIIKQKLGEGSYGQVYLGEWNKTEVAVKIL